MADPAPDAAKTPSQTQAKPQTSKTGTPKSTPSKTKSSDSKTKSSESKTGGDGGGDDVIEKKMEEEKPPKISKGQKIKTYCKDICSYIYNPKTHLCMGRNCKQWCCLLTFLLCSYTAVGMLFAGLLSIVLLNAPVDRPKYIAVPDAYFTSKIQQNPGIIFVPEADQVTNQDSAVILLNSETKRVWGRQVDTYLKGHDDYWKLHQKECKGTISTEGIVQVANSTKNNCFFIDPGTLQGCDLKDLYGYAARDGHIQPTFIVRLSRVWGWKPEPFDSETAINETFKKVKGPLKFQNDYVIEMWNEMMKAQKDKKPRNGVFVLCDAETDTDNDLLGQITYCTPPFIDGKYFPFKSQAAYVSPFIIIQVKYAAVGIPIKIQCYPFAKNIKIEKGSKEEDSFEFMID